MYWNDDYFNKYNEEQRLTLTWDVLKFFKASKL